MVHRAGELLVEWLKLSRATVAADHRTPDVDSGFPALHLHSASCSFTCRSRCGLGRCCRPKAMFCHTQVWEGRSFETENRSGDRGKAG